MFHTAEKLQSLPAHFFSRLDEQVARLKAAGQDIIRLDAGSPDLPPAAHILEALARTASLPEAHGYQSIRGTPELRCAWATMYQRSYGVELDPEREVLPLLGSKEGIFHLVQACIGPGEVVLGPDPGYMTYWRATAFVGGEYHPLALLPENHYLPDLQSIPLDILRRARLLWLNYPHNPTSAIAPIQFLEQAVAFACQHKLLLCHDAAYTQVTFEGYRAPSLLSIPGAREVAVEFNSLSKSHNMAGWRLGAALGNPEALQALFRVKANVDSGHFLPVMQAAVAAMTGGQAWLVERNSIYQQRRDLVIQALGRMGLSCDIPRASLYVWFSIPHGWASEDFASLLLEKASVSLTPGTVFGKMGEGYLRLSITQPVERIKQAMQQMHAVVGGM